MREARLLGRDHPRVGPIAALAEGPLAIALSAGGAPKTYDHSDANEDAVGFAGNANGALLVVADAHAGCIASETAVACLLEFGAPAWLEGAPPARWPEQALKALWETHMAVRRAAQRPERQGSRTTLALALLRSDSGRLYVASVGDSHIFRVSDAAGEDLAEPGRPCLPRFFLGSESLNEDSLGEAAVADETTASGVTAVVLATDGLSEKGVGLADPAAAVAQAVAAGAAATPELRALETARGVAERSNAAHRDNPSGDNVGVAVVWLGD
jgi:serine/threonine protein phosphatase PrpC